MFTLTAVGKPPAIITKLAADVAVTTTANADEQAMLSTAGAILGAQLQSFDPLQVFTIQCDGSVANNGDTKTRRFSIFIENIPSFVE